MGHYPDRANRIPTPSVRCQVHVLPGWNRSIPYADKIYLNIHREGLLECVALLPPNYVLASKHLVCKGNLLVVPRGEQAHLRPIRLHSTKTRCNRRKPYEPCQPALERCTPRAKTRKCIFYHLRDLVPEVNRGTPHASGIDFRFTYNFPSKIHILL